MSSFKIIYESELQKSYKLVVNSIFKRLFKKHSITSLIYCLNINMPFKVSTRLPNGSEKKSQLLLRSIRINKDGLPEKAEEIMKDLRYDYTCQIEVKDSIGKRYRRQDAIGTPYCITVDGQTLEDNTVTLRYRDTMQQERVAIADLHKIIGDSVNISSLLRKIEND